MGWFRSLASFAAKPLAKILPDWADKPLNSLDKMTGGYLAGGAFAPKESDSAAPAATTASLDPSSLSDEELTAEAQKRLAKLGKYFTSPLGVLSSASTGSQRIFS
jgi:hypothetical protein